MHFDGDKLPVEINVTDPGLFAEILQLDALTHIQLCSEIREVYGRSGAAHAASSLYFLSGPAVSGLLCNAF
jgi:hypothetical protein